MKKALISGVFLLGLITSTGATPLLVESYQEGQINIPPMQWDTLTVVEINVSLDSSRYVQFSAGGLAALGRLWLDLDEEILPPEVRFSATIHPEGFGIPYSYLLDSGDHVISLKVTNNFNDLDPTTCEQAYLQALIFLPDTATGAIAEPPDGDAEPTEGMTSVISSGPYVTVTGATELVDATGRVIEHAIDNDKVSINALPQGTYFARDGERTVVKIVKVQ